LKEYFAWTDEAKDTIRRGVADKLTARQIAEILGVTRNMVIGAALRYNIKLMPQKNPNSGKKKKNLVNPEKQTVDKSTKLKRVKQSKNRTDSIRAAFDMAKRLCEQKPEDSPEIIEHGVAFCDIRDGQCRYPLWTLEDSFESKRFCGRFVELEKPYCSHHCGICYVSPPPPYTGVRI